MKKCLFGMMLMVLFCAPTANAETIVKEILVQAFSELELKGVGNVFLTQGEKESVRIETDTNLISTVEVENEDNKLTIYSKIPFNTKSNKKMDIYITVHNLSLVRFSAVGNVTTTNILQSNALKLFVATAGDVNLNLTCGKLVVNFSGVGNLWVKGTGNEMELNYAGVGNMKTSDFKVNKAIVNAKGVGNVEVYAANEIVIDASGIGNVTYKGHPKSKHISDHGIGSVNAK